MVSREESIAAESITHPGVKHSFCAGGSEGPGAGAPVTVVTEVVVTVAVDGTVTVLMNVPGG